MAEFGRVHHFASRFAIIGTGPSIDGVDLTRIGPGVCVIAINAAIKHVPRADLWFTMDPSEKNLKLMRSPRPGTHYYAALASRNGRPHSRLVAENVPEERITYLKRVNGMGPIASQERLAEDPGEIHAGNSAFGALNLVYHGADPWHGQDVEERPEDAQSLRGILLGIDGGGAYAWGEKSRTGPLEHLPELFRSALIQLERRGIEVWNGSPHSTIDCFPRVAPELAIAWVSE